MVHTWTHQCHGLIPTAVFLCSLWSTVFILYLRVTVTHTVPISLSSTYTLPSLYFYVRILVDNHRFGTRSYPGSLTTFCHLQSDNHNKLIASVLSIYHVLVEIVETLVNVITKK